MKKEEIFSLINQIEKQLITDRRYIHQNPELSFCEKDTMNYICKRLDLHGIPYKKEISGTGVLAEIRGSSPGKCLLFRADMDALPITECNDVPYKSKNSGFMHACGHDCHTAILLNACEILNKIKGNFSGTIKFAFQPGEESTGGAKPMIEEGILNNPNVDCCVALHMDSDINAGTIRVKPGEMYAAIADFSIKINGKGGHGAEPHNTIDPIVISSYIISQLQSIVSRNIDPMSKAVVTVGSIHAGETNNVIPDNAHLLGTARAYSNDTLDYIGERIESIIKSVCDGFGATYEFIFDKQFPPVINDENIAIQLYNSCCEILGDENCIWGGISTMASEDFAFFCEEKPSVLFKLGCRNEKKGIIAPIHNANFDVDESSLKYGVALFTKFALDYLN